MDALGGALASVVIAIAASAALFVGASRLFDLAVDRWRSFLTVSGALIGVVVGAVLAGNHVFGGLSLLSAEASTTFWLWAVVGSAIWQWAVVGALAGGAAGAVIGSLGAPSRASRERLTERGRIVTFLGPAVLFVALGLVIPLIRTIYLSVFDERTVEWVGLANYGEILTNEKSIDLSGWADIFTSRLFFAAAVLVAVGLLIGMIAGRRRGRVLEPLPSVIGPIGIGLFVLSFAVLSTLRGTVMNNLWWVVVVTALSTGLGLAAAVLADRVRWESVAKSLIFLPMAISFVGAGIIWRFMYIARPPQKPQTGVLNAIWAGLGSLRPRTTGSWVAVALLGAVTVALAGLCAFGLRRRQIGLAVGAAVSAVPVLWLIYRFLGPGVGGSVPGPNGEHIAGTILFLQEAPFNNVWLMVVLVWIQTGFAMVILSAAIKAVPSELLEAARVDGATERQTFWHVTMPTIVPTITVVATTLIVLVMKVYDIVKVMTAGNFGTQVIANEMWQRAFTELNFGLGSALAVVLFLAVVPAMAFNIRRMQRADA
ncbi:carbohydrate ABC transporter permease [Candidatus Poriferisodalis sp.]|uniref:carbohydrate ABC transporter permease n=1 Tax=Candidatus Poriferisodalis sp. TaxID=3101277 RepID=UPI003C702555